MHGTAALQGGEDDAAGSASPLECDTGSSHAAVHAKRGDAAFIPPAVELRLLEHIEAIKVSVDARFNRLEEKVEGLRKEGLRAPSGQHTLESGVAPQETSTCTVEGRIVSLEDNATLLRGTCDSIRKDMAERIAELRVTTERRVDDARGINVATTRLVNAMQVELASQSNQIEYLEGAVKRAVQGVVEAARKDKVHRSISAPCLHKRRDTPRQPRGKSKPLQQEPLPQTHAPVADDCPPIRLKPDNASKGDDYHVSSSETKMGWELQSPEVGRSLMSAKDESGALPVRIVNPPLDVAKMDGLRKADAAAAAKAQMAQVQGDAGLSMLERGHFMAEISRLRAMNMSLCEEIGVLDKTLRQKASETPRAAVAVAAAAATVTATARGRGSGSITLPIASSSQQVAHMRRSGSVQLPGGVTAGVPSIDLSVARP